MDRASTARRAVRVRATRLLFLAPLFVVEFLALSHGQVGGFLAGIAAVYLLLLVVTAVTLTTARIVGARIVYLRVGIGPTVRRSATGDRLIALRAFPLGLAGLYLPAPAKFGRDFRLIATIHFGAYLVVLAAGALLLPPYGAAAYCWLGIVALLVTVLVRDPSTGRRLIARVALRPTPQTDPALADPHRAVAECAVIDAQYGDLIAAERALADLRASSAEQEGTALLESEILAVRGDFTAAAQVEIPIAADASETLRAARIARYHSRELRLLMLAVEKEPALAAQLMPKAAEHVKKATAKPYRMAAPDRTGQALLLLRLKKYPAALREAKLALRVARTPLTTADALCTLAIVVSLQGKAAAAHKLLAQATRIAPWYPRVTTVQQIVAQRAGAAAVLPAVSPAADTSTLFDDPWSAPSRD
jgi:tetratricopeptide (TPR) repeat protein